MDRADEAAELEEVIFDDLLGEQESLKVVVGIGDSGHGEKIFIRVFEDKGSDRAGRSEIRQILQGQRFGVNSARIGEPIDINAKLGQCLLEDPALAIFAPKFRVIGQCGRRNSSWLT